MHLVTTKNVRKHKSNCCKWLQNPDTFSRNDLPKGKDLKGENLNENLPKLFKYTRVTLLLTNLWKMPPRKAMKAYTVQ